MGEKSGVGTVRLKRLPLVSKFAINRELCLQAVEVTGNSHAVEAGTGGSATHSEYARAGTLATEIVHGSSYRS